MGNTGKPITSINASTSKHAFVCGVDDGISFKLRQITKVQEQSGPMLIDPELAGHCRGQSRRRNRSRVVPVVVLAFWN